VARRTPALDRREAVGAELQLRRVHGLRRRARAAAGVRRRGCWRRSWSSGCWRPVPGRRAS
jgi:hypothetical protein